MRSQQEYNLGTLKASASYDPHKVPLQTYIYALESKNVELEKAIKKTLLEKITKEDWIHQTGKADILSIALSISDNPFACEIIQTIGVERLEKIFKKANVAFDNTQSNFYNMILKNNEVSSFVIDTIQDKIQDQNVRYNILATLINKGNLEELNKYLEFNTSFFESLKVNKSYTSLLLFAQDYKAIKYLTDRGLNIFDSINYQNETVRVLDQLVLNQFTQINNILTRYGKKKDFNPKQINRMKKFANDLIFNYTDEKNELLKEKNINVYAKNIFVNEHFFNLLMPLVKSNCVVQIEEMFLNNKINKLLEFFHKKSSNSFLLNQENVNINLISEYLEKMSQKEVKFNNFTLEKIKLFVHHKKSNNSDIQEKENLTYLDSLIEKLSLENNIEKEKFATSKKLKI